MQTDYDISINRGLCVQCGLCEAFCPVNVFTFDGSPEVAAPQRCWGCETCAGQCPKGAIAVTRSAHAGPAPEESEKRAEPLDENTARLYRSWADTMTDILKLRWHPVGITLVKTGQPLPDVPVPKQHYRYCQSLMAARRGKPMLMPANRHACPDGTSILGLTGIPEKLASGELYILFHKLDSIQAAQRMVGERPSLPERSVRATVTQPLASAKCEVDVVAVVANPEQMMWLMMADSYYTGHRHNLFASGYNAQCVETTLIPYTTGEMNISFGCYGCRASSDVPDDCMMMGIPVSKMPQVIKGLEELGKKAIPQSRDKIYLPPLD